MKDEIQMEFWKRAIDFIFKQVPVVAASFVFCIVMGATIQILWAKIERMQDTFELKIETNNKAWAASLEEAREDWRMCEQKREALALEVAKLKAEFIRYRKQ